MTMNTAPWRRRLAAISVPLLAATCLAVVTSTQEETFSVVTPTRIMPLGDSITRGTGSSWGDGYRLPLTQSMVLERYTSDVVGSRNNGPPWLYDRNHGGYGGYGGWYGGWYGWLDIYTRNVGISVPLGPLIDIIRNRRGPR